MTTPSVNLLAAARMARGWTQAELAEAIARCIQHTSHTTTGIDADYISRLERGLISWPAKQTRMALEELFDCSATELGLVNRRLGGPQRRRRPCVSVGRTWPVASDHPTAITGRARGRWTP
ncbi:multiprotein-bridging factor 1 family protein [Nocardia sp. NPDC127526]|uniref:helix-turn-helix domain-containing protein n=1 Tax=Nocardia sp. NPDC127526 TaxID=3345393 RepID=UPI0036445E98